MADHYDTWREQNTVEEFATKKVGDFFASETHHIKRIIHNISSVLDVGCASGKFIDLLHDLGISPEYVGIDITLSNVESARKLYPDASFHHINALNFTSDKTYDLVNATGVCQHEPAFEDLIRKMVALSQRYILFDLKLADIDEHIINRSIASAGEDHKLYFNILAFPKLLEFLKTIPNISGISVFGYETPTHKATIIPASIKSIVSTGVLLTKCDQTVTTPSVKIHLPEFLHATDQF